MFPTIFSRGRHTPLALSDRQGQACLLPSPARPPAPGASARRPGASGEGGPAPPGASGRAAPEPQEGAEVAPGSPAAQAAAPPLPRSAAPAPSTACPACRMAPRAPPFLAPAALLCSGLALCLAASSPRGSASGEQLFRAWASQHRREYSSEAEFRQRLQIFLDNKQKIDKHNAGNSSFRMGLNQFSDLTFPEFRRQHLWREPQNCSATTGNFAGGAVPYPKSIDWRKKGRFVSPVKDQGPCGSCWTFSTTGCLESAIAIKTGKLLNLAEQQLIDCAQDFNNHGCNGGLPSQAFEYILYNKGLMDEETYPYRAQNGTCKFQPQKAVAFIKEVVNISLYDEQGLVQAVGTYNPVSIAFEVKEDFVHYQEGVYSSTDCDRSPGSVNHAVLAVGYGDEGGLPFWIVKNSWGPAWGLGGYFNIERGKNMCGLADCASFPVPLVRGGAGGAPSD